jgi:DEAD/DEAH box helicase domain-containing protein
VVSSAAAMPKLRRVGQRITHQKEQARQKAGAGKANSKEGSTSDTSSATNTRSSPRKHSSINYNGELFRGEAQDVKPINDALETPSEKRRRLLSKSAASAVESSRKRFEREQLQKEKERVEKSLGVRIKEEEDVIVLSASEDERTKVNGSNGVKLEVKGEESDEEVPPKTPPPADDLSRNNPESLMPAIEEPEKEALIRDFEWPEHYLELERTFKALNTVYAFCSGRKYMATTFDTIKSSVEGLLKRPLEVMDIAQIKSLCPDLINFAYIDADLLEVHLDGRPLHAPAAKMKEGMSKRAMFLAQRAEMDQLYAEAASAIQEGDPYYDPDQPRDAVGMPLGGGGWQDDAEEASVNRPQAPLDEMVPQKAAKREQSDYVLFFEFNDGTLQGPKATARGRPGMRRGPNRQGGYIKQMPDMKQSPSPAAMKKLIDKRNYKFEQAALELLTACRAKEEDAVQILIAAAEEHVPVNPELSGQAVGETPKKRKIRLDYLMKNPDQRPDIIEVIEEFKGQTWYKDQIVPGGHRTIADRPARYEGLTFMLSQEIVNALWATRRIEEFYLHQADALNALDDGKNIIVSTSTSSGKSLIYQVPVLRALQEDYSSTAMFIFPTKALAQDQKGTLQNLLLNCDGLQETIVATYDGDTPKDLRVDIKERASVIFTNPDMLHMSILPQEISWRRFLRGLRFVVVDELHMYNGLFGAHVSFIMRRLRRICNALGNRNVRFVSCSATVDNPKEHMSTLFGVDDVEVILEDGSPAGRKEWIIWNPPLIDSRDPKQGRVSAYAEVSKVFRHLVERGVRTIIFTKVRRTCEIVINQIRHDLLLENRQDIVNKVMSYRSGYSPEDRRKIEQDMFNGQLLGIVATSALELGIDIGTLDAVIMLGFPYSISSLRQQAGRAGRRQKDSLALLVGDPFPMDQHYMKNPEEIFTQPDTILSVDLKNDFVMESHLQCAAMEMPLDPEEDTKFFGDGDALKSLCENRLEKDPEGFYHCRAELRPFPAREVAIRGARQITYTYLDDSPSRKNGPRVMEEVEVDRAIFEAFEGAVFMHQGLSYICKELNHEKRIARMVQADVNFHTRPRNHTDTDAVETHRIRTLRGTTSRAYYGHVRIETHVWGYFKVDRRANILDSVDVDCPPFIRDTKGLWIDVPLWIINALTEKTINAAAAIHAAEHALLSLTPMFVVSLAGDVKTECKVAEKEYARKASTRKRPARLIFYDTPGQNAGVSIKAFEHLDGLIRIATSVIEGCPCIEGCPACVTSQTCAHANLVTSKVGALGVLRGLLGLEPFDPDLPQQNEPGHAEGSLDSVDAVGHTIREAPPVRTVNGAEIQVEEYEERLPPSLQDALQRAEEGLERGISSTALHGAQSQRHVQRYAAPPLGKSMHYDEG